MSNSVTPLFGDYGPRTLLRISGADAANYLHNLCTQDIRALKDGACTEAFVTSVQGKTLGYVRVFRLEGGFLLDSSAGQGPALLAHFEKYHIREKVVFEDLSHHSRAFVATWDACEAFLQSDNIAPPAEKQFRSVGDPPEMLVANWQVAGPGMGYGIFIHAEANEKWDLFWQQLQGTTISKEEVKARWIAAGSVEFGADMTSENLPQEIARDTQAISFNKGCYLGQETVARIDALGHVNRLLVRLRGDGKLNISADDAIEAEGKAIGHITSAAFWEVKNEFWAIGLVRRGHHAAGTELLVSGQRLRVVG